MSNIDIYKDDYKNRGVDFSYKCRNAITFKVRVQAATGYAPPQAVGWRRRYEGGNIKILNGVRENYSQLVLKECMVWNDITAMSFPAASASFCFVFLFFLQCKCASSRARAHIHLPPTDAVRLDMNPSGRHVRQCA